MKVCDDCPWPRHCGRDETCWQEITVQDRRAYVDVLHKALQPPKAKVKK